MNKVSTFEAGETVLGRPFDDMADTIAAFHKRASNAAGERWCVNGFNLMTLSNEIEGWWALDKYILSYGTKDRVPTRLSSARSEMDKRWKLTLRYREAAGEAFEFERQFTVTNRHDKVVGKKTVRLQRHSIVLEHAITEELVAKEVAALCAGLRDVVLRTSNIEGWTNSDYDMLLVCKHCCHRSTIKSEKLSEMFGGCASLEEAAERLRCSKCNEKGRASMYAHVQPIQIAD